MLKWLLVITTSLTVLFCITFTPEPGFSQQITFTNNYRFPLIPRGYKQYWDIEYNAAMNSLEVLFNKTAFIDKTNIFLQPQRFSYGLRSSGEVSISAPLMAYEGGFILGNLKLENIEITGETTKINGNILHLGNLYSSGSGSFAKELSVDKKIIITNGSSRINLDFSDSDRIKIIYVDENSIETELLVLNKTGEIIASNNAKVWTSDNDGEGSGLDADLLDGKTSAELMGGDIEGTAEINEETSTTIYQYEFSGSTGAVRLDISLIASLPDSSSGITGHWVVMATKTSDGTVLVSEPQMVNNVNSPSLNAALQNLDNISLSVGILYGSIIEVKLLGTTSGIFDPNKFLCSYKVKFTKL